MLDAEVISMALNFFSSMGLMNFSLHLNSIGCKKCRPIHMQKLKEYYDPLKKGLCEDCLIRLEKNPLRLLDCKKPGCQEAADAAPKSADFLCEECHQHFQSLIHYLQALDISYVLNPRLVRGLDYYTKTVFEIQPLEGGSQSALGGGGRYDDLIAMLGGKPTPAIGFATGIERIVLNLKSQNVVVPGPAKPTLFIACMGDAARIEALKIAASLRDANVSVIVSTGDRSLKAQLRQANTVGATSAAIIGDDEVKAGTVMLRNMENGEQQEIQPEELKRLLSSQQ